MERTSITEHGTEDGCQLVGSPLPEHRGRASGPLAIAVVLSILGCGRDHVGQLAAQLEDDNIELRRDAAARLGAMGNEARSATSALRNAVHDQDREVRRLASRALGEVGGDAQGTLPVLLAALGDDEESVRLAAAFAIERIDRHGKLHVPVLRDAMLRGDGGVIVAVGQLGERSAWAVPTLIALLSDRRPGIRRIAADALGLIGDRSRDVVNALQKAADDEDDRVQDAARKALRRDSGVDQE